MTKKQISKLKKICVEYGAKLVLKKLDSYGQYDDDKKIVYLHKDLIWNEKIVYSILFHELGHKYCCDNNIYVAYHHSTGGKQAYILTALRAEKFVDNWAAKELKKRGFKFRYPYFYSVSSRIKKLKEHTKQEADRYFN
jgi:hypothetical protein